MYQRKWLKHYKHAFRKVALPYAWRDFEKNVTTQVTFTEDDGIAKFKVTEGNEYLIDNVIIEVNEDPKNDAVWSSYWAALTFRALDATQ